MVVQHSSTGGLACRHDVAPHGALQTPRTQVAGSWQGGSHGPPVGMVVVVVVIQVSVPPGSQKKPAGQHCSGTRLPPQRGKVREHSPADGTNVSPGPQTGGMVVVVVSVVEVVAIVVDVVLAGPATTATRPSTQSSTSAFTVGESVVLWQSFGFFASSFVKQPFVASRPPVYFATALSTQPFVFGSAGFPGVWASLRHLSRAARYFDAHFFLPAPHFV